MSTSLPDYAAAGDAGNGGGYPSSAGWLARRNGGRHPGQLPAVNERLAVAVKAEREKGMGMVKSVLDRVREGNEGWFLLTEISTVV